MIPVAKRVLLMSLTLCMPFEAEPRDCDCRAFGRLWRQGETVCLDGGERVCGMSGNVTSWIGTGRGCPEARKNRDVVKS
jgi:hypothetical protein